MMLELVANSGLPTPEADFPAGEEALARELRKAVRAIATAYDERDPARACWPDLTRLGVFELDGALGLGLRAQVICCAELGRELHDDGLLDRFDGSLAAHRIRRGAWLTGLAASCLAATVARARTRTQFGRPLIENQDVAFRLARLKIHHDAVWALLADLAAHHDDGLPDPALAAGALAEAGTLAVTTTREAVQLHGAFGMTVASPVRRHYLIAPVAIAADAPAAELYLEAAVT
jgi:hypothetical protein